VGEVRTRHADVRLVAATNRDLDADVRAGGFREDLLFRRNVIGVHVPPLRERAEDLLPLVRHFLALSAGSAGRPAPTLSRAAEETLRSYGWPVNVRELRNAIESAVILTRSTVIEPSAFSGRMAAARPHGPTVGGDFTLDEIEREQISRVVARTHKRSCTLQGGARGNRIRDGKLAPRCDPIAIIPVVLSKTLSATVGLLILTAAAAMEVAGDAVIRKGVHGRNFVVAAVGFVVLGSYGVLLSLFKQDFSRLLGVYVGVFALISALFGRLMFGDRIAASHWLGLAVIVLGCLIIQLGYRAG
jgi:drug/metabolite transporter superfamily protein YnfA